VTDERKTGQEWTGNTGPKSLHLSKYLYTPFEMAPT
jgi:hypothetical protein